MLVKVVREKAVGEALPSKIYLDDAFFCYGLENDLYKVNPGRYGLYSQHSDKFGKNKLYVDVPGRSGILFHGGNTADQSRGCVLTGKTRDGVTISGDVSDALLDRVNGAYKAGESVAVQFVNESYKWAYALIAAGVLAVILNAARG